MVTTSRIATTVTLGLLLPACTQIEKLDGEGPGNAGIPTEVQRAFDESCNLAGCHESAAKAGGLDLSATAAPGIIGGDAMFSDLPLVELGNVQGSFLALKVLGELPAGSGAPMPIGNPPPGVDGPTNVAIILGWIAGADLPGGGGGSVGDDNTSEPTDGTTTEPMTTTGEPEARLCGIADVAPSAPNPFDIGMNAGQIPPDIGEVLTNNCGCHEVDPTTVTAPGAFPYAGAVHFSTIAELQAMYLDPPRTGIAIVRERMESTENNRMPPPYYCDLGDGTVITPADRQLLIDWLAAEAPDAPTWMP